MEARAWVYRFLLRITLTSWLSSGLGPSAPHPEIWLPSGVYWSLHILHGSKLLLWSLLNLLLEILFSSILQNYKGIKYFGKKFQRSQK